uniref:Uncharacterized protein n=1 Tax=Anguilla anguilla TaxID=7936 RepID=A0A0E9RKN8_ANGAN
MTTSFLWPNEVISLQNIVSPFVYKTMVSSLHLPIKTSLELVCISQNLLD